VSKQQKFVPLILLLLVSSPITASEWEKLEKDEQARLFKGEIIYKSFKQSDPQGKISGGGQSMALVNAPIDKCWEIFTRFDKQQEYFPRKTASVVIEQKPGFALVYKKFRFYLVDIEYYNQYLIDQPNHRIDFSIDLNRPHDIKDSAGFFLFEKISPDQTLFTYGVTRVDTGLAMPSFVQDYMQKRDLPAVAGNVRKRIESGGTWKKGKD